jgi:superfamily II DNA or RNA helicase
LRVKAYTEGETAMPTLTKKISALTLEFRKTHGGKDIWDIFNRLRDLLIANDTIRQDSNLYQSVLSLLTDMGKAVRNIIYKHYINSFRYIYEGEKAGFLAEIEQYIQKFIEKHVNFSYEQANWSVLEIISDFSKDDAEYESYLKKLLNMLTIIIPQSAFCAYINYLLKTYKNKNIEVKVLKQILEIDPNWYVVHIHIGDIYYGQQKWQEAIDCYEAGVAAGDLWKTADIYFYIGWAYGQTKQHAKSIENYKKCLEITPDYRYANNNLGFEYKKIKDYDQALLYFDKSISLGINDTVPFRNKLETLIKANRNGEAIAFATENPTHFTTKYYRELLSKASRRQADTDKTFEELKRTTANEYAGTITINNGRSGLPLYAHQQDAIRDMSRKILNKDKYAGLLVLPTGGGKTLTAAYWLMGNILDGGQKVIWLAHRHELLDQARTGFEKVSYTDIARRKRQYNFRIISGQHDKPVHIRPSDDVIIASKTSLHRGFHHLAKKWLSDNSGDVFLVIDEAHHATAKEYRELIEKIREAAPSVKVLGLTATPFRTADSEQGLLKKIFYDDIAYKIDLRELINRGILAEPIFEEVETEFDMLRLFQTPDGAAALERIEQESFFDIESIGKDIATKIAQNAERNNVIVNKYLENREKYGQTLVFALNVPMAFALNAIFKSRGIESDFVVSDVKDMTTGVTRSAKENSEKIQKFRDGRLNVLINVNILTEGTDLPKVQTVFLTRPTKSTILMTQMMGRALRGLKAGGTKECYIVSFVDDWQNRIAWVNPERLFIDENADFIQHDPETRRMAMRLVAIQKIEEFAKIADGTLEGNLERLSFIERIPVGLYKFSYLEPIEGDEDEVVNCDVLVYDCMEKAYKELFDWFPDADLNDVDTAAQHISDTLFTETDRLIGYSKQDIADIIRYYKQTEELPEFIAFNERDDYDVSRLAKHIVEQRLDTFAQQEYISGEWNQGNSRWSAFYGLNNQKAFRKTITDEIDKILNPDDYEVTPLKPITQHEQFQIQDLPLYEIRQKFPELGEKIRTAVFDRFTDTDGYYYSAQNGFRSRNKLDFQIDHIEPMAKGGKTVIDNLQLLTRAENMQKGAN